MRAALEYTKMNQFILDNDFQWPFLFFRALVSSTTSNPDDKKFNVKDVLELPKQEQVQLFWGDVQGYLSENDAETLAEVFEEWYEEHVDAISYQVIGGGQINEEQMLDCLSLNLSQEKNPVVIAEYQALINEAVKDINKKLNKKRVFAEYYQKGGQSNIDTVERWLDAAMLQDINAYVDGGKVRLDTLDGILASGKGCWRRVVNLHKNGDYKQKSAPTKSELKWLFDQIDKDAGKGRAFINSAQKGLIKNVSK